jgi:hypothetical protein
MLRVPTGASSALLLAFRGDDATTGDVNACGVAALVRGAFSKQATAVTAATDVFPASCCD